MTGIAQPRFTSAVLNRLSHTLLSQRDGIRAGIGKCTRKERLHLCRESFDSRDVVADGRLLGHVGNGGVRDVAVGCRVDKPLDIALCGLGSRDA